MRTQILTAVTLFIFVAHAQITSDITGNKVTLTSLTQNDQYSWSFGDGSSSSVGPTVAHYYAASGTYKVTLTVRNMTTGHSATYTLNVRAPINNIPQPSLTFSLNGYNLSIDASGSHDSDGSIASYTYSFGDGTSSTSNASQVWHVYPSIARLYIIGLTVTDNSGAKAAASAAVQTSLPPIAIFDYFPYGNAVILSAALSSGIFSTISKYTWNLGDNITVSTQTPQLTHYYPYKGDWAVSLVVTDANNLNSTKAQGVIKSPFNAIPTASFLVAQNVNKSVSLNGSKSSDADGSVVSFEWDFGDSNITYTSYDDSSDHNFGVIQHTYQNVGFYNISLTVQDNSRANSITLEQTLLVFIPPTPRFSVINIVNDTVRLDPSMTEVPDGQIVTALWDFGDNTVLNLTSTSELAIKTYKLAGFYNITLTVTDNFGITEKTAPYTVFVNTPPSASYTVISNVDDNVYLDASASSDPDGSIIAYIWNFGDGESLTTTSPSIQHSYSQGNVYNIQLTVVDNYNATSSTGLELLIDIPPNVNFSVVGIINNWVIVNAEASILEKGGFRTHDRDGSVQSITWDFGDGTPSITNTTYSAQVHQYTSAGNFTISLFATDNNNISSAKAQQWVLINNPPTAAFSFLPLPQDQNYSFDTVLVSASQSIDTDGYILTSCWDFGDGSELICLAGTEANYTYLLSGTYNVTLYVVDNLGAMSERKDWHTITVNIPPFAGFEIVNSLTTGEVYLEANTDLCIDLDGTITSYSWDYGDNSNIYTDLNTDLKNVSSVKHVYRETGFYNVTVTVVDNMNASGNMTLTVFANVDADAIPDCYNPLSPDFLLQKNVTKEALPKRNPPVADLQFWIDGDGQTVGFSAAASRAYPGIVRDYIWDFGDGTTSQEISVSHTYSRGGPFIITLTVTDGTGASTTKEQVINLNRAPIAIFSYNVSQNYTVSFDATQSFDPDADVIECDWDFGDGSTNSNLDCKVPVLHAFPNVEQVYQVTLTVTDTHGATTSLVQTVILPAEAEDTGSLVFGGLPLFAQVINKHTHQYLSLGDDDDELIQDERTSSTLIKIFRNLYPTKGYFLTSSINDTLCLGTSVSDVDNSTTVEEQGFPANVWSIYRYANGYYRIIDDTSSTMLTYSISDEKLEMIPIDTPSSDEQYWSIASLQDLALKWNILS